MAWLDATLVGIILVAAACLLGWRLLRTGSPPAPPADVVLKGALGDGLARAQRKRR